MKKVTASEATRNRIAEMLRKAEGLDRSEFVRQAARLVIEEALEAEISEASGCGYDVVWVNPLASATGIVVGSWKGQKGGLSIRFPKYGVCRAGNRRLKRRCAHKYF